MVYGRRHNPVLEQRLKLLIENRRWQELIKYLGSLPNADFRSAGCAMSDAVLQHADADVFYETFCRVVNYAPKAFLVTLTKLLCTRLKQATLTVNHPQLFSFAAQVVRENRAIDRKKFVTLVLPVLEQVDDVCLVFKMFAVESVTEQQAFLLQCSTMPSAYLLFRSLKHIESDVDALKRCCLLLKRRGDRLSFNLASVIICYFGLTDVSGTFSLHLRPYELNYLDVSYDTFCKVMNRI